MARVQDTWPQLLESVKNDDGLPTRECGAWTEDKLWFWNSYIAITTRAMVGSPKWRSGLAYVDLFGGPGVCRVRESGKRLPGSPLIAANAPKPFERILLCELDKSSANACEARMKASPAAGRFEVVCGDSNETISTVVKRIPAGALTLAFIDPEGLDVQFETLRQLADGRRVDFLLLFADAIDLVRNVEQYEQYPDSKLDQMLGPDSGWRKDWAALENRSGQNVRSLFPAVYKRQIKRLLGYEGFREEPINGPNGPLYRLIYASKSELGLEFWDKIAKRNREGQRKLF